MTRDEIEALPPDRLTALLAERVMGWTRPECQCRFCQTCWILPDGRSKNDLDWQPTTDRDDLAELVLAVPSDAWDIVDDVLEREFSNSNGLNNPFGWVLTCDAEIICRAVAVACCGGDDNA